jgi:hydroxyethylthiazole kinase-like uncharacterized protein yjeF
MTFIVFRRTSSHDAIVPVNRLTGYVLTAAEMRAAETACGTPLQTLMDRAGCALAEAIWRYSGGLPALIICGPGNNGGDGYVAARLLAAWGLDVTVAASGEPKTELAAAARGAWDGPVGVLADAQPAPVLVDALFGTGSTRPLDAELAAHLHRLARAARTVIAVDVPSGVGTDDGCDFGGAQASITICMAAAKPAHFLQPAAALCGTVRVADIGVPCHSGLSVLARPDIAPPGPTDHKYTRGMVVVIGGMMAGAGALSAISAARSGSGYVVALGIDGDLPHAIVRRNHDNMAEVIDDKRIGAVVIGPGLGHDRRSMTSIRIALASPHALVLDGDALRPDVANERAGPTVMTPHAGEFARMFGDLTGSKIERTRQAANRSRATIVFKGADTVIASPGDRTTICPPATPWLSTAGTGDVLAGITGAMLARGLAPHDAACAAVWLHGEAARRAGPGMIADDILAQLPACL